MDDDYSLPRLKEFAELYVDEVRSYQPSLPPEYLRDMIMYTPTEEGDQHAKFRMLVLSLLFGSFSLADRAFLRMLLEQEIVYHRYNYGFSESIKVCAFMLFVLAEVEDVQLLWEAKTTSFDTMCGLNDQLLVGAGIAATLDYLRRADEPWSERASKYISEGYPYTFEQLQRYQTETRQLLAKHMEILYKRWETSST
ncbi:hypothetical protein KSF_111560 [Reticulibacter mediterranei]|uniref:Uncharacterized protein n=1 Tax=Reticulibacter mediterranei TaxID=2778369 RepID=A0A8J3N9S2_9CHLR|nr:hypothetical protein [Reticulibacter mediterranei]GHP01109.1 hypothetical protein KSF_111560 [Reticulibacter mediterranei]